MAHDRLLLAAVLAVLAILYLYFAYLAWQDRDLLHTQESASPRFFIGSNHHPWCPEFDWQEQDEHVHAE